jgi:hypothetical protein
VIRYCVHVLVYPSYIAGILKSVKCINFYLVCTEKPKYGHYIKQCVDGKNYNISDTGNNLLISYDNEFIFISFETRIVNTELPYTLTLVYNVLTKMRVASLAYGKVSLNRRVTFKTSEVLIARHDCVSNIFAYNLDAPMRLGGCKIYIRYCSSRPSKRFSSVSLLCTKQSHRL